MSASNLHPQKPHTVHSLVTLEKSATIPLDRQNLSSSRRASLTSTPLPATLVLIREEIDWKSMDVVLDWSSSSTEYMTMAVLNFV